MANVKTAVSIETRLFDEAESIAREMKLSRSRLFAVALEEFIRRHQNQCLLDEINNAYPDKLDATEKTYLRKMRRRQHRLVEGEW